MLALSAVTANPRQACGNTPAVLSDVLQDGINLAAWQHELPPCLAGVAQPLLTLDWLA